jgi:hypothetical protein
VRRVPDRLSLVCASPTPYSGEAFCLLFFNWPNFYHTRADRLLSAIFEYDAQNMKYSQIQNFDAARLGGGGGGEVPSATRFATRLPNKTRPQSKEEFFNHYKNDLKRHAHTPSGDAGADLKKVTESRKSY